VGPVKEQNDAGTVMLIQRNCTSVACWVLFKTDAT